MEVRGGNARTAGMDFGWQPKHQYLGGNNQPLRQSGSIHKVNADTQETSSAPIRGDTISAANPIATDAWVWDSERGSMVVQAPELGAAVVSQRQLMFDTGKKARYILRAENPPDDRIIDSEKVKLVEIATGGGQFEWLLHRLAAQGHRVGIAATSHTHVVPGGGAGLDPATAILISEDNLDSAIDQRRTYATSHGRSVLHVTTNSALPGSRIATASTRNVQGWLLADAPIDKIELIKNGKVFDRWLKQADATEPVSETDLGGSADSQQSVTIKVSFLSGSVPFQNHRDFPRNGREWIGYVRVLGVPVLDVQAPGFYDPVRQAFAWNEERRERVDFITWTRGGPSSLILTTGISDEATVEVLLASGYEDSDVIPRSRPPAELPPARFMLSLYDLLDGPVVRSMNIGGYSDTVTFEIVEDQPASHVEFRFSDSSPPVAGDYYYVRASLRNDAVVWSSPVWVGGFDPK